MSEKNRKRRKERAKRIAITRSIEIRKERLSDSSLLSGMIRFPQNMAVSERSFIIESFKAFIKNDLAPKTWDHKDDMIMAYFAKLIEGIPYDAEFGINIKKKHSGYPMTKFMSGWDDFVDNCEDLGIPPAIHLYAPLVTKKINKTPTDYRAQIDKLQVKLLEMEDAYVDALDEKNSIQMEFEKSKVEGIKVDELEADGIIEDAINRNNILRQAYVNMFKEYNRLRKINGIKELEYIDPLKEYDEE